MSSGVYAHAKGVPKGMAAELIDRPAARSAWAQRAPDEPRLARIAKNRSSPAVLASRPGRRAALVSTASSARDLGCLLAESCACPRGQVRNRPLPPSRCSSLFDISTCRRSLAQTHPVTLTFGAHVRVRTDDAARASNSPGAPPPAPAPRSQRQHNSRKAPHSGPTDMPSSGMRATTGRDDGRARIGCSGWQYAHWRGSFYPADLAPRGWLGYYAARFDDRSSVKPALPAPLMVLFQQVADFVIRGVREVAVPQPDGEKRFWSARADRFVRDVGERSYRDRSDVVVLGLRVHSKARPGPS